jgi:hypothetical protein
MVSAAYNSPLGGVKTEEPIMTNGAHRPLNPNVVIVGAPHPDIIRNLPSGEFPREVPIHDLVDRADRYVSIVEGKATLDV